MDAAQQDSLVDEVITVVKKMQIVSVSATMQKLCGDEKIKTDMRIGGPKHGYYTSILAFLEHFVTADQLPSSSPSSLRRIADGIEIASSVSEIGFPLVFLSHIDLKSLER